MADGTEIGLSLRIDLENANTVGDLQEGLRGIKAEAEQIKKAFGETSKEYLEFTEQATKKTAEVNSSLAKLLQNTVESAQSVGELRQAFKAARDAAIAAGEGTDTFHVFSKIASDAKDRVSDLGDTINALDPGAKAQAFQALGTTMVGGFQAATGALAVFTGDNEDLNRMLMKSMALVQGLQGIQAIADSKKQLGAVAAILGLKGQDAATKGLTLSTITLKGALSALGIGVAITLIATLIANIDAVTNKLKRLWNSEKADVEEAIEAFNRLKVAREFALGVDDANIKLMKAQGAAANEVYEAERRLLVQRGQLAVEEATRLRAKQRITELTQDEKERLNELIISIVDYKTQVTQLDSDFAQKRSDATKKTTAEEEQFRAKMRQLSFENQQFIIDNELTGRAKVLAQLQLDYLKELDAIKNNYSEKERATEEYHIRVKQIEDRYNKKQDELQQPIELTATPRNPFEHEITAKVFTREKLKEINAQISADNLQRQENEINTETAIRDAKLSIANSTVQGMMHLSSALLGEGKKGQQAAKALAGIQLGIDTAEAIGALAKTSERIGAAVALNPLLAPAAPFMTAAAYGTGIVRILGNIAKAKTLLGGGGPSISTSTPSPPSLGNIPSVSQRAPNVNVGQQRTLLDEAERRRREGGQKQEITVNAINVITELTELQTEVAVAQDRAKRKVR